MEHDERRVAVALAIAPSDATAIGWVSPKTHDEQLPGVLDRL